MYEHRHGGSAFGAFLFGGIIGAIVGILFAPRSGRETREMIAARSQDYMDQAKDVYDENEHKLVEAYSTARGTAAEKAEELKGRVDEAREALKVKVDEASVAARGKVTELGKDADSAVTTGAQAAKSGIDAASAKTKDVLGTVADKAAEPAEPSA